MIPFKSPLKKEKNEKKIYQQKIIMDSREKNSLVLSNLVKKKAVLSIESLEIGDYLIGNIAIERKTYSDFISSMINKRIFIQLKNIKNFPRSFLIIEGDFPERIENENLRKAAKGLILEIITKYKIPIIFTKDEEETSEILLMLARKKKGNLSLRPKKSYFSLDEQKQFILEGFPGIGPKIAKELIKEYKTLKKIFNVNGEELKNILGKKYEKFKEIIEN